MNSFKMVRLGDIGQIITGNTPSKSKSEYYNSKDVMFIKPNSFNKYKIAYINSSKDYVSDEGAKFSRLVEMGTVLVTCIGSIGNVAVLEKKACFNQQINGIVPNDKKCNN